VPNIQSAKKRMRQAAKRRANNRDQKSALRSAVKKVREAGSAEESQAAYQEAERLLDRAARKGLVAKNKAARDKGRLKKAAAAKGAKK
jgi:small subunit ribosomal protein S20